MIAMKVRFPLIFLLLHLATLPEARANHVIRLLSGDVFRGTLSIMETNGMAVWQHPLASKLFRIPSSSIVDVQMTPTLPAQGGEQSTAAIELTNGDRIIGRVQLMDAEKLVVQTTAAGTLNVRRPMLTSIAGVTDLGGAAGASGQRLFGWVRQGATNTWVYRRGGLEVGQGTIARNIELPSVFRVDFDMAWQIHPELTLRLFADPDKWNRKQHLIIAIEGQSVQTGVSYTDQTQNIGMNTFGYGSFAPTKSRQCHVTILVDNRGGRFDILIDGKSVMRSNAFGGVADTGPLSGSGVVLQGSYRKAILQNQFRNRGNNPAGAAAFAMARHAQEQPSPTRISGFRLSSWDGQPLDKSANQPPPKLDTIALANGDIATGTIEKIADNQALVKTAHVALNIPIERALNVRLAASKSERARRVNGDVRVYLVDGSQITMMLESITDSALVGSSENFGRASVQRAAVDYIQFNIYDSRAQKLHSENWGF